MSEVAAIAETPTLGDLESQVDALRMEATGRLARESRVGLGQFFTPLPTARLMAGMFGTMAGEVALLDPGAGIGSLTASWVAAVCSRPSPPTRVKVTAYEIDDRLLPYLAQTLDLCRSSVEAAGISFESRLLNENFVEAGTAALAGGLFANEEERYDAAILNPPYQRLTQHGAERRMLQQVGLNAENMYSAFVLLAAGLLRPGGQIVAITPRSWCNGTYFRSFREDLLAGVTLRGLHVFHARNRAFAEDSVLQENLIFEAVRTAARPGDQVVIGSSEDGGAEAVRRNVPLVEVVHPDDAEAVVWIPDDEGSDTIKARVAAFSSTLTDLDLNVSTGRVVDFRAREWLRNDSDEGVVPLLYPANFAAGKTNWPVSLKKPNALLNAPEVASILVPSQTYVLVKRFSSKEEAHRLVAAVFEPESIAASSVGFENHLNYYHENGKGLPRPLAFGLAAYLNSPLVDDFFRLFSGHTQVNAADLRRMPYPSRAELEALGRLILGGDAEVTLSEELTKMAGGTINEKAAEERIEESLGILRQLGMPRAQLNERSALTLLALVDLGPETPWSEARAPLIGITPMMEFMTERYGKRYAPNTRETVRRQTVHQMVDAGVIVLNPDDPSRPTNSPKTVYQVEEGTLELIRSYGASDWDASRTTLLASRETLRHKYAAEREMVKIPVRIGDGTIYLYPGGQNVLIKAIVEEFCPRFTPGGKVLYIGDADAKFKVFDQASLEAIGVGVETHGKMPDVVIYYGAKDWLLLIEAVTSHGPVDSKRHGELQRLFANSRAGLVYVTAFLNRGAMVKYLRDISWATDVWVAESPSHMIHFNGDRFLGPHESGA